MEHDQEVNGTENVVQVSNICDTIPDLLFQLHYMLFNQTFPFLWLRVRKTYYYGLPCHFDIFCRNDCTMFRRRKGLQG